MTHKILIADDEPNIVISLEYLLQRGATPWSWRAMARKRWMPLHANVPRWCCSM